MQINTINGPQFKSVARVSSNTQHKTSLKVDSYTKQILGTWQEGSDIYQNKEVSKKVGDFLRAQLGTDTTKGGERDVTINQIRTKCFSQNNCYCYTGKDAQRYDSIYEQARQEKAMLDKKYGLDTILINELERVERKAYSKELLAIEARSNARAMALLNNQAQLILDIDEKTGNINSISYLSLVSDKEGNFKWSVESLKKEDIYSSD